MQPDLSKEEFWDTEVKVQLQPPEPEWLIPFKCLGQGQPLALKDAQTLWLLG